MIDAEAREAIDLDAFLALASKRLNFAASEYDGDFNQDANIKDYIMQGEKKPAAVLIPLVERNQQLHVILTKRTDHLSSHSGQVAFPGGKIDDEDADEIEAALRECEEEIGLRAQDVKVIGRLPDYYTGSGYRIAPVIGVVNPEAKAKANPDEVDYVFEVPLSFLMNTENHIVGSRTFNGSLRYYLEMPFNEHYIWGVTAGIIHAMFQRVFNQ